MNLFIHIQIYRCIHKYIYIYIHIIYTLGTTNLSTYFLDRLEPSPRINPCLMVKGNTLYIYGGMTELGDIEVTLDDCWALDLNKRDTWKEVLPGTMHNLVWKGDDEMDTGTEGSEA
jgi:hypothetical protein